MEDAPMIPSILKIFEPTTFPTAMSPCLLIAAIIYACPAATTVNPITRSEIPYTLDADCYRNRKLQSSNDNGAIG